MRDGGRGVLKLTCSRSTRVWGGVGNPARCKMLLCTNNSSAFTFLPLLSLLPRLQFHLHRSMLRAYKLFQSCAYQYWPCWSASQNSHRLQHELEVSDQTYSSSCRYFLLAWHSEGKEKPNVILKAIQTRRVHLNPNISDSCSFV